MDGVIVIDKPAGWTSHDAVNRMRRLAGTRRVGHLGTLDPLATGVLPLIVGRATRLAQFYARGDKVYDAVIRFGQATDSYDRDGVPTTERCDYRLDRQQIESLLEPFRGTFLQTPPPISAKKIGGRPAYQLARKNIPVNLEPVEVTVQRLDVVECEGTRLRIQLHCSAGTYLRGIAHELGRAAGCGAHLEELRRTAACGFSVEQARSFDELQQLASELRLEEVLIPGAQLLPEFPSEVVDRITASQIRNGRDFRVSPFRVRKGSRYVKALGEDGDLIAVGEAKLPNLYHPILVL
ncbi:MAG: tRNA pseudouridine(55) synthase TruB [Acidobacteria bacterium]|nr:tRNA pseudouridine(55) synthase TruB [Acidobacteriota bacterium]